MRRIILVASIVSLLSGCDGQSPSAPSPTAQSTPLALPRAVPLTPPRTLFGYVSDTAFRSVNGARIEVIDGAHTGVVATSDDNGFFSYEQPFETLVTVRASKDGYAPSVATSIATSDGRAYVSLRLPSVAPPVSIGRTYTLTISVDPACAFPEDVRTRSYLAALTNRPNQVAGTDFDGTVTGGQFMASTFWVGVFGDYVAVSTAGEGPSIVEQVGPNRYVAFFGDAGVVVGPAGTSTLSAPFRGSIEYCELKSGIGRYYDCAPELAAVRQECSSNNSQLTLARP